MFTEDVLALSKKCCQLLKCDTLLQGRMTVTLPLPCHPLFFVKTPNTARASQKWRKLIMHTLQCSADAEREREEGWGGGSGTLSLFRGACRAYLPGTCRYKSGTQRYTPGRCTRNKWYSQEKKNYMLDFKMLRYLEQK